MTMFSPFALSSGNACVLVLAGVIAEFFARAVLRVTRAW